jgi:hypothetical protein
VLRTRGQLAYLLLVSGGFAGQRGDCFIAVSSRPKGSFIAISDRPKKWAAHLREQARVIIARALSQLATSCAGRCVLTSCRFSFVYQGWAARHRDEQALERAKDQPKAACK